tara:strand:- start:1283 stop:1735 length:453 start_codon:yes stop_codon:yes gene_type:complete
MGFKMKGEPMKRNFGVGAPTKLKKETEKDASPVKRMGIYEVDPITEERRQIPRDEYLSKDEGSFILTGRDAEQLGNVGTTREDRIRTNKGLAENFGFTTPRGRVAQGEKAQARARELDNRIQDKINEGIPLTDEEKMYQRRAMGNVGINE